LKDLNNIWKYLQEELGSEGQAKLQEWKARADKNKELFEDIEQIWSESGQIDDLHLLDAEEAWLEIEDQLKVSKIRPMRSLPWVGMAASILLIVAAFWWFSREEEIILPPLYESYTAVEAAESLKLPDSSEVKLNQGSTLRYYTRIDESLTARRVFLEGNATFEVMPNDTLPFIVEAAATGVKVLGTVFTVAIKDSSDISVENLEGLIQFYELANEANSVTLKEGEVFNYDGAGFVDKTLREVKAVEIPVILKDLTIQELWYELLSRFGNKIKIAYYGSTDPTATIRININQPLQGIIQALELNARVDISYTKTCPDCFEIESLTLNK
jgi:ferric-dicitrate binding protein FerR (iron transport regulator)